MISRDIEHAYWLLQVALDIAIKYYMSTATTEKASPTAIPVILIVLIQALPVALEDEVDKVGLVSVLVVFEGGDPTRPGSWSWPSTKTSAIPLWVM